MRTTVNIDEPVLLAVKSLAAQSGRSVGAVVSELLRKALSRNVAAASRNGIRIFPTSPGRGGPATMELVNRLRDGDPT